MYIMIVQRQTYLKLEYYKLPRHFLLFLPHKFVQYIIVLLCISSFFLFYTLLQFNKLCVYVYLNFFGSIRWISYTE